MDLHNGCPDGELAKELDENYRNKIDALSEILFGEVKKGREKGCIPLINVWNNRLGPDVTRIPYEINTIRRICKELVLAWKFAETPEIKKYIEKIMDDSRLFMKSCDRGEECFMDTGTQIQDETVKGTLFPKEKVKVIERGWIFHDGVGEYLLEKAIVIAAPPKKEFS